MSITAIELKRRLTAFTKTHDLRGVRRRNQREQFVARLFESERKLRALRLRMFAGHSDPHKDGFHPLKAVLEDFKNGKADEAVWLAFLCIHFGRASQMGDTAETVRLFYGRFGHGAWDWRTVSKSPKGVKKWMLGLGKDKLKLLKFGNHRKYETNNPRSPVGTPSVVGSFIDWANRNGNGSAWRALIAARKSFSSPEVAFDRLFESLEPVKRFGRTAKFDYLCLLGNLGILDITPPHCYLRGSTGPKSGAILLVTGRKKGKLTMHIQEIVRELRKRLGVSVEALEDSLCNWQKGVGFISRICQ